MMLSAGNLRTLTGSNLEDGLDRDHEAGQTIEGGSTTFLTSVMPSKPTGSEWLSELRE
jgi:hypothetical protein